MSRWVVVIPARSKQQAQEFVETLEAQAWGFMWTARIQKLDEVWRKSKEVATNG